MNMCVSRHCCNRRVGRCNSHGICRQMRVSFFCRHLCDSKICKIVSYNIKVLPLPGLDISSSWCVSVAKYYVHAWYIYYLLSTTCLIQVIYGAFFVAKMSWNLVNGHILNSVFYRKCIKMCPNILEQLVSTVVVDLKFPQIPHIYVTFSKLVKFIGIYGLPILN